MSSEVAQELRELQSASGYILDKDGLENLIEDLDEGHESKGGSELLMDRIKAYFKQNDLK